MNAIFPPLSVGLMKISNSFTFQAIQKLSADLTNLCCGLYCKFLVIFGYVWAEIVFLKGFVKFREIRNIEDLMKF